MNLRTHGLNWIGRGTRGVRLIRAGRLEVNIMVRSSGNAYSSHSEDRGGHAPRRIQRQRRYTRRPLPPLDLRSPSGRSVLPY